MIGTQSFYWTNKWRKTAALFMESKSGICERCGRLAYIVHHKEYITPKNINNPDITLNWDNLEALCSDCHNKEHNAGASIADGLMFDANGDIRKQ